MAQLKERATHFATMLIDGAFLALWVVAQWGIGQIIEALPLDALDSSFLLVFRLLFGAITIVPVALSAYRDTSVLFYQVRRSITEARAAAEKTPLAPSLGELEGEPAEQLTDDQ